MRGGGGRGGGLGGCVCMCVHACARFSAYVFDQDLIPSGEKQQHERDCTCRTIHSAVVAQCAVHRCIDLSIT